jgi:hypothetical protein
MRISDAERAEVADLLSAHYSDGRLDQAEFNQRLDQAMHAKTYAELGGLLADLPHADGPPAAAEIQRRAGRSSHPLLVVVAVVVIAVVLGRWLLSPFFWGPFSGGFFLPWWLWVGGLAFVVLRFGPRRRQ